MNEKQARKLIEAVLDERTQGGVKPALPQGYNPLEIIRGATFHLVPVPFNGTPVWCELRCLNASQILALGNYSNIDHKGGNGKISRQQIIDMRNYQEKLIRAVMNKPLFDEIASLVGENDFVIKDKRKELDELKELVKQPGESWPKQQQLEVKKKIDDLELFMGFILPEDAFGFLTAWASGNDISDIKKISDLAQTVLRLYGAKNFEKTNAPANIGYKDKNLVIADSPNKITNANTIKRALEYKQTFLGGGWNKVIILGWNFSPDISYQKLNKNEIELLVIPPDLLDLLKKKNEKDLENVRFSSLQYLTIKIPIISKSEPGMEKLTIELENYVLLSPDILPLDDANKAKVKSIVEKNPLDLIEYWSIDPDYDGTTFRSLWQDYRENKYEGRDGLRVIHSTTLTVPEKQGKRKICVKAVDVFGFESACSVEA
jgi:hypothetical protein